jgi:peptidoglycan LD-endopeptidase CwlK
MKRGRALAVAAGVLLVLVLLSEGDMGGPVSRDWSRLNTRFAGKLRRVFERLQALGWSPVLNEGWRSRARAQALAAKGSGVALSMHCYGLAADIRDAVRGYDDPAFFRALGDAAEAEGLTWGGRWERRDATHVQAVPVREQARVRAEAEKYGDSAAAQLAVERVFGVA